LQSVILTVTEMLISFGETGLPENARSGI